MLDKPTSDPTWIDIICIKMNEYSPKKRSVVDYPEKKYKDYLPRETLKYTNLHHLGNIPDYSGLMRRIDPYLFGDNFSGMYCQRGAMRGVVTHKVRKILGANILKLKRTNKSIQMKFNNDTIVPIDPIRDKNEDNENLGGLRYMGMVD